MVKSHLKDFSHIADRAPNSETQKEMILEADVVSVETVNTHEDEAMMVVKKNMYWMMGAGIVPVPILDLVCLTGFQLRALKQLSDLYGVPFSHNKVKNILATLIGGLGPAFIGRWMSRSFLKSIPILNGIVGILGVSLTAGALSYAIGRVFIQHFESGGTFLTFQPQKVRDYFRQQFEEGLKVAAQMEK